MSDLYTPNNWYWIVAGDTTRVYSSADAAYVTLPNAAHTAWLERGNLPTRIVSEAELWDVLAVESFRLWKHVFNVATGDKGGIAALMHGLDGLTVEDKSYVLLARIMALKDGLTMAQVQTATTRAQATAYVTGKTEWTSLPTNTRPMMADVLETMAGMIHLLILVLS